MSGPGGSWAPVIGERVRLVKTGQLATVLRLSLTEWGLLCDLQFDPLPGSTEVPLRRPHASTELQPVHESCRGS